MCRIIALLVNLGCMCGSTLLARAQSAIELSGMGVTYTFGAQVAFSAIIHTQTSIQAACLLFQGSGCVGGEDYRIGIPEPETLSGLPGTAIDRTVLAVGVESRKEGVP
jgi:hypothetical protein